MSRSEPPHEPWATWLRAKDLLGPGRQPSWGALAAAIARQPSPVATPTRDTIRRIATGINKHPGTDNIKAIADGLGIKFSTVAAEINLPSIDPRPWTPPMEVRHLGSRQRNALDELIRAMAAATEEVQPRPLSAVPEKVAASRRPASAPRRGTQVEKST